MYGLIEIVAATLILATIFGHRVVRHWLSEIGAVNRNAIIALLALLVIGQAMNESRKLFPFVRWGMYTEIYDDEKVLIGKFQALHANGEYSWVNPTVYYPSLARNNHDRVQYIMTQLRDGELSPQVTRLFDEYMLALGVRHAARHRANPVVEIHAVLQAIESSNHQVFRTNHIVRTVQLESPRSVELARTVQ